MAVYDLVLLDADGTLFDFQQTEEMAFFATFSMLDCDCSDKIYEQYKRINSRYWMMLEEGKITKNELVVLRYRDLFRELGLNMEPAAFNDAYLGNLAMGGFLMPGALETVKALYGNCRMAIVTNGVAFTQYSRIKASGLLPYMEAVIVSDEVGCQKPDALFFDYVFQKCSVEDRTRTIMVGDSLSADIRGGNDAGIATCWMNPEKKQAPGDIHIDYQITEINQLIKIVLAEKEN